MDTFEKVQVTVAIAGRLAILGFIVFCVIRQIARNRREKTELRKRIQDNIEKILEDGKVEGPKGPYVRHKEWNVGLGMRTPHETEPEKQPGPYGIPRP